MPILSEEDLCRVADMAPSILNTKPWSLRPVDGDDRIELRADWKRRLEVIDPRHRELVISCGAALFNVRLAIRVTGHDLAYLLVPLKQTERDACPKCGAPGLLASIEIALRRIHRATSYEQRLYETIPLRHTVREPFSQGIHLSMVAELVQAARKEGVYAVLLHDRATKGLLKEAAKASRELAGDKSHREELQEWTGGGARVSRDYGVPASQFAPRPKNSRYPPVRDVGLAWDGGGEVKKFEKHPTLIALMTKTDTPSGWMRMGQALQRLLLTAARYGVEASFLTQQLEVDDWKRVYERTNQWWPSPKPRQMVVRLGYTSHPADPGRVGDR